MWSLVVSFGAVHNDSTVSVVSFNVASTLKQKVGVALPASAAPPPKDNLTNRESSEVLAADSVGRCCGREEATSKRDQQYVEFSDLKIAMDSRMDSWISDALYSPPRGNGSKRPSPPVNFSRHSPLKAHKTADPDSVHPTSLSTCRSRDHQFS